MRHKSRGKRLLEKLNAPEISWLDVIEKYAVRYVLILLLISPSLLFLYVGITDEMWYGVLGGLHLLVAIPFIRDRIAAPVRTPTKHQFEENPYSELYLFRIVKDDGFARSELVEERIHSGTLEEVKRRCAERARHFLDAESLGEWEKCDFGFVIRHGNIDIELVTEPAFMPDIPAESPV